MKEDFVFQKIKSHLVYCKLLVHYDPILYPRVACRHVDHVRSRRVNDEKDEISVSGKELPPELPLETQDPVQADPSEVTQP